MKIRGCGVRELSGGEWNSTRQELSALLTRGRELKEREKGVCQTPGREGMRGHEGAAGGRRRGMRAAAEGNAME